MYWLPTQRSPKRDVLTPEEVYQKESAELHTIYIYFFKFNHFHFYFLCVYVLYHTYYFNIVVRLFNFINKHILEGTHSNTFW